MYGNNWWPPQGQVPIPQVIGGEAVPAGGLEGGDWRTQLQLESRQRIVNKIMETLKRHLPFSGQEGLQEVASRFEEHMYTVATSQSDYLRKISLEMLRMETKSQNPLVDSLQSDAATSQSMQPQMQNQVQQLPIPMVSNQSQVQQQLLSQNIQNNIPSTGVPNSAGLASALPPVGGMSQGILPNFPVQNPNIIILASSDSSSQTGNASGGDWQEEIYQKIKSMHEMYYPELYELYLRMAAKLQQHDTLPQQPKNEQLEKLRFLKVMLERLIMFLRTNKNEIQPQYKDKIVGAEKQIVNILNLSRPPKPVSSLQQGQLTQQMMQMNQMNDAIDVMMSHLTI